MGKPVGSVSKLSPWDQFQIPIQRTCSQCPHYSGLLESGVAYFILQLERMGARTMFSCEGHPRGFYIAFWAKTETARAVTTQGFFRVELMDNEPEGDEHFWRLSMPAANEMDKRRVLQQASEAWNRAFGSIRHDFHRCIQSPLPPNKALMKKIEDKTCSTVFSSANSMRVRRGAGMAALGQLLLNSCLSQAYPGKRSKSASSPEGAKVPAGSS